MGELDEKKAQIAYFEKAIFVLVAIIVALVVWLWEKSFQVLELTATMIWPIALLAVLVAVALWLNFKVLRMIREMREL